MCGSGDGELSGPAGRQVSLFATIECLLLNGIITAF